MSETVSLSDRYLKLLLDDVVPFWDRHGIDHDLGGFFTCLDRDGARFSDDKYVWLQGRAVWMYSELHRTIEARPGWLTAAERGLEFIERHAFAPDGRVYFSLRRTGEPIKLQRKIYGAVFVMLAYLGMYRVTGRAELLERAQRLFWRIHEWWQKPELLGRERLAGERPATELAAPMVFLGMLEELAAAGVETDRERALTHEMLRIVDAHVDADAKKVYELAPLDGARAGVPAARVLNPGHSIELGWFLLHTAERLHDAALTARALQIVDWSLDYGWDKEFGGLYYFLDAEGRPPPALEWSMKLWWPHCEALYATLLAYRTSGDPHYMAHHERIFEYCRAHFMDPEHGEWLGYLDRQGRPTHWLKGGEYKGFFHVPRALLYCARAAQR